MSNKQERAAATRRSNRLATDRRRAEAAGFHARGEQDWVPVELLFSDPRYQRDVDHPRVARMAAEFDPDALGVITVSERPNGRYAVLDGFHRVELMRYLGWDDQKMPAFVYTGLTVAEEAVIFTRMNKDRRQPTRFHLFKAQVTARDPDAVAVHDVFTRLNLTPSNVPGPRTIRSLATADKIVKIANVSVLETALRVMLKAWDESDDALNGDLLSGLALLVFSWPDIDTNHLAVRLADHTPGMIMNKSRVTKEVNAELTLPAAVATVVTAIYNTRLRVNRLPQFPYRGWPRKSVGGVLHGYGWSDERIIDEQE